MTYIGRIWLPLAELDLYWLIVTLTGRKCSQSKVFCSADSKYPLLRQLAVATWLCTCFLLSAAVQQSIDMSWQSQTLLRILCEQCQQADWGAVWRADSGGSRWWRNLANMMDRHVFRRRCGCRYHYCSNLSAIFWLILFSFYSSVLAVSVMLCHWNSLHRATRLMSTFRHPVAVATESACLPGTWQRQMALYVVSHGIVHCYKAV